MSVFCYSQKILNPFRGMMNIISIGGADAVSIDGINWTLYIHDTFDCPIDDPEEFFEIDMPDIRYGDWSREKGFSASPLIASYHYNEIQAIGHVLLDAVKQHADQCPFPFNDKYELWLLDAENDEPLALLASVCQKDEMFTPASLVWEAGLRCKQEFLKDYPLDDSTAASAGELLNRLINARAGKQPRAQWFLRDELNDGTGLDGVNIDNRLRGRKLSSRMFPKLLVQRYWQNPRERSLFNDFINWLSPYLLVLDYLRDRQREALEQTARQHALLVDRLYRLYPRIVNPQLIRAARVEAMLRKSA